MRAVIYARSSKERHDVSIPSQVDELRGLAKREGDAIVQVFKDKAESAKTDDRPAFQEMMTLAKAKDRPFDRIYCYDTSRFSRRREHATAYKALLKKAGVDLVFLKLPKSDSYVDTIIEGVFEVFDEFTARKAKRTVSGECGRTPSRDTGQGDRHPTDTALFPPTPGQTRRVGKWSRTSWSRTPKRHSS